MRIYFDMDGVLAKWKAAPIEEVAKKGYFRECEPEHTLCEAYNILYQMSKEKNSNMEIYILSSVFCDDHSADDKLAWIKEHLIDANPIFVNYGSCKSEAIIEPCATDILIDDFSYNLHEWHGVGIKVYNGINGTHGTWNGFSVHTNMSVASLVSQLLGIINTVSDSSKSILPVYAWKYTNVQLPPEPTWKMVESENYQEYLVTINGASKATTLKYIGDGDWSDMAGGYYPVIAWAHMPMACATI